MTILLWPAASSRPPFPGALCSVVPSLLVSRRTRTVSSISSSISGSVLQAKGSLFSSDAVVRGCFPTRRYSAKNGRGSIGLLNDGSGISPAPRPGFVDPFSRRYFDSRAVGIRKTATPLHAWTVVRSFQERGNILQTHLDKKTFKIMTYNVWFQNLELNRRMDAIGNLIKRHSPDILCLQEVTPCIYLLLQSSDWWKEYNCLLSPQKAIERPYYCMQFSKGTVRSSESIPFSNSIMGRELCVADIQTGETTNLVVATTHLESPCPGPPTWDQMYRKERLTQAKKSLEILGCYRNSILCGDMNWDDKGDGPFPMLDGWIDVWVELKPSEDGWTYDTKANGMLSRNNKMQSRLDRFVCKLENFKIDGIEMIGTEAIPGVSYTKEKKIRKEIRRFDLPVFPSDHFGLILTVTQLENYYS